MASRMYTQFQGTLEKGVVKLFGTLNLGTGGTLASQAAKGLTVTKTAAKTGRYTVTLQDKYTSVLSFHAVVRGSADAAYPVANGIHCFVRNINMATRTFEIQFARTDTGADAEVADNASVFFELTLKNSSTK